MELNIDRGLKSYDVKDADGTLIGTIRFNPSDIGLAGRMEEARARIAEITAAPVTGPEDLVEWDRQVRHWFDYIFGTPVSDVFLPGYPAWLSARTAAWWPKPCWMPSPRC